VVWEVVNEVLDQHIAYIANSEHTNDVLLRIFVKNLQQCAKSHPRRQRVKIEGWPAVQLNDQRATILDHGLCHTWPVDNRLSSLDIKVFTNMFTIC
jgi:hypothetical protein